MKKRSYARARRWLAELLLVFIGVYAAFWLSDFQQGQQQARQRDQILASLERQLREGVENTKAQAAKAAEGKRQFQQALESGQRPKLRRFTFTTDYNPGDIATILQAGGIELLDVKTLTTLREFESVVRWGLSRMAHYQKLSDELIAPNLGQDSSFFYEENGHLHERFNIYPEALQAEARLFQRAARETNAAPWPDPKRTAETPINASRTTGLLPAGPGRPRSSFLLHTSSFAQTSPERNAEKLDSPPAEHSVSAIMRTNTSIQNAGLRQSAIGV